MHVAAIGGSNNFQGKCGGCLKALARWRHLGLTEPDCEYYTE